MNTADLITALESVPQTKPAPHRGRFLAWDRQQQKMFTVVQFTEGTPAILAEARPNGMTSHLVRNPDTLSVLQWVGTFDSDKQPLYELDVVQIKTPLPPEHELFTRAGNVGVIQWIEGCWVVIFGSPDKDGLWLTPLYPVKGVLNRLGNRYSIEAQAQSARQ